MRRFIYPPLRSPISRVFGARRSNLAKAQAAAVAALFSAGEQGGWYDPSDFSTLFQDSAGTTPVTAAGQPVGRMLDKSGRGNHLMQATAGARPTLQTEGGRWFLLPDGVDDRMVTASFNPVDSAVLACAGIRKLSDATQQCIFGFVSGGPVGTFRLSVPNVAATTTGIFVSGGTVAVGCIEGAGVAAPFTGVYAGISSIADDVVVIRRNGVQTGTNVGDQGTGSYQPQALELFTNNGANFSASRFYGGIIRFSLNFSTGQQTAAAEAWVNSKTGAY
jgi:hypothetical protein